MKAIREKLARVDEVLAMLTREVVAFEAAIPKLRIERGFRLGSSTYAFRAYGDVEAPLRSGGAADAPDGAAGRGSRPGVQDQLRESR